MYLPLFEALKDSWEWPCGIGDWRWGLTNHVLVGSWFLRGRSKSFAGKGFSALLKFDWIWKNLIAIGVKE